MMIDCCGAAWVDVTLVQTRETPAKSIRRTLPEQAVKCDRVKTPNSGECSGKRPRSCADTPTWAGASAQDRGRSLHELDLRLVRHHARPEPAGVPQQRQHAELARGLDDHRKA